MNITLTGKAGEGERRSRGEEEKYPSARWFEASVFRHGKEKNCGETRSERSEAERSYSAQGIFI